MFSNHFVMNYNDKKRLQSEAMMVLEQVVILVIVGDEERTGCADIKQQYQAN